jgi:ATP-dependent Lon protease
MEIIQLSGYTIEEKTEIAARYLVPKQLAANGLSEKNAEFTEQGLRMVIEGYTREAGVRNLEREIGSVCRKIAVEYAKNKKLAKVQVTEQEVENRLGARKFSLDETSLSPQIGAAVGLAWTAVGGTTLSVEATIVEGKGEVKLTGKLGDVMKESALAALTHIRANAEEYGVDKEKCKACDLHVHVPEGATPKDGPSAGITIATATLSALTGKRVRGDIAMTGEITLRGNVLPIGGLKEKALAARRVGIKEIIIPKGNEKDIQQLPTVVKNEMTFHPVSKVKEVFDLAILKNEKTVQPKKKSGAKRMPLPLQKESEQSGVRC